MQDVNRKEPKMYRVQNAGNCNLAIRLEKGKGSIILDRGSSFDLDGVCSRKWIKSDPELQSMLSAGLLVVLHDSEIGVPKVPTKMAVRAKTGAVPKRVFALPRPEIIDLSNIEDPVFPIAPPPVFNAPKIEPEIPAKLEPVIEDPTPIDDDPIDDNPEVQDDTTCSLCGKSFVTPEGLARHMKRKH